MKRYNAYSDIREAIIDFESKCFNDAWPCPCQYLNEKDDTAFGCFCNWLEEEADTEN